MGIALAQPILVTLFHLIQVALLLGVEGVLSTGRGEGVISPAIYVAPMDQVAVKRNGVKAAPIPSGLIAVIWAVNGFANVCCHFSPG